MERTSSLSAAEIVGAAAASAAALGSVFVALGRSQASSARERTVELPQPDAALRMSRENVERGRELARQAASAVVASYPQMREGAADLLHRAASTARPQASRVSSGASTTADQVRATGATVLDRLQEEVLPAASTMISGLVERAGEARERSAPAASDLKSVAAAKADVALTKSTSAAKDTVATVAWTAAALSLIYFVLLSPERREQIKTFLWGAVDQTLVLVRDFQGYEDDF
jgi:hypothetical protein